MSCKLQYSCRIYLDRQGLNLRVMALIGPSMALPDAPLTKPISDGQPKNFGDDLRAALLALQVGYWDFSLLGFKDIARRLSYVHNKSQDGSLLTNEICSMAVGPKAIRQLTIIQKLGS